MKSKYKIHVLKNANKLNFKFPNSKLFLILIHYEAKQKSLIITGILIIMISMIFS